MAWAQWLRRRQHRTAKVAIDRRKIFCRLQVHWNYLHMWVSCCGMWSGETWKIDWYWYWLFCTFLDFYGKQRQNGSKLGETSDRNGSPSTTLKLSKPLLKPIHSSGGGSNSTLILSGHLQRQLKAINEKNNNNNSTNKNNNNNNQSRLGSGNGNESGGSSSSIGGSIGGSIGKSFGLKRNSPSIHQSARSFQYESFHVFDWRDYLIVSISTIYSFIHPWWLIMNHVFHEIDGLFWKS